MTILLIEDEPDIRELIVFLLSSKGYEVLAASDGHEALEMLSRSRPALILLDMKMPGMDGWTFVQSYRKSSPDPAPIVVVTAAEDARKRAEEVGALGAIGKPFDLDDLVATVQRFAPR
jgi:CheY-like chemotaxis protein